MAGGEGTRLRPLTSNVPKPLLPVVGEPIMGHLLRLLAAHGVDEAVVTVQYLASAIRSYFGDGSDYGVRLSYSRERTPLGTAGSVKNAEARLHGEPFLVVSGDSLTDVDLSELIAFHQRTGAMVSVALVRKPNVIEFGNVIMGADGRIERFVEKPSWGQVVSDLVNTGIYVMDPRVLELVPGGEPADWSADVFPQLMAAGEPIFGCVMDAYWEDVGTIPNFLSVQADVLNGRVRAKVAGFEVAPQVWLGQGALVDPQATLVGPCFIGANARVGPECIVGPGTVLGNNVVLRRGVQVVGSLLSASVYADAGTRITGALVGRASEVRARCRVDSGAVIADECLLGEEVHVRSGVHIYPAKRVESGAVVSDHVIMESQAQRTLFGPRGVSGVMNLDITPELVVRLAAAFAALLPSGSSVTLGRDHSRAARAMNRALAGSLTAAGLNVRDLRIMPLPIVRSDVGRAAAGGVYLRTTLGVPESLDLLLLGSTGSDLTVAEQQQLERILARRDFRRAFPSEIGDIHTPHRSVDEYSVRLATSIDTSGVAEANLKVVVDTGSGTAALVLPRVLAPLAVSVLTVNNRLDEAHPTSTWSSYHAAMAQLAELVASSKSDLGVRFDPTGERLSVVDESGRALDNGRALLVMLDLVAAERRSGTVALPASTTRVAEAVAHYHSVGVTWTGASPSALSGAAPVTPGLIFAGDGRGGFIVPEMGPNVDGIAAFVRLVGLVARTQLTLSAIEQRIPESHMARAAVPTPWARRGAVMRALVETAGHRAVDTAEGVRIEEADGAWVLAVPDQTEAVIQLWVEADSDERAEELLSDWFAVIESAVA